MKLHNAQTGSIRFPIAMQVRYRAISPEMAVCGVGRTKLISSTEVIFTTDQEIAPGMQAEVSIAWPVLLDDRVKLQLIIKGVIRRAEGRLATVQVSCYHYRTRGPWGEAQETAPLDLEILPLPAPDAARPLMAATL